ncbi:MAG: hypothetical protein H6711_22110 [Myxococcales bacterium]|nr:hypothetical protein [Myxococcales bacterium]
MSEGDQAPNDDDASAGDVGDARPVEAARDPNARDDELLADPPETDFHLGRLGGYRAAGRMRSLLAVGFAVATVAAIAAGYYYITYLQEHRTPVHAVPLPEGSDLEGRPRTMTWSGGKARLGLTREPPGLLEIELPDRTLRLADGCDSAQVRVNVDGGRTVEVTVLFGEVDQVPAGE